MSKSLAELQDMRNNSLRKLILAHSNQSKSSGDLNQKMYDEGLMALAHNGELFTDVELDKAMDTVNNKNDELDDALANANLHIPLGLVKYPIQAEESQSGTSEPGDINPLYKENRYSGKSKRKKRRKPKTKRKKLTKKRKHKKRKSTRKK